MIGDIHGALKALEQLLSLIEVQSDDQLIFLGDYVDGWSQSADVIEYLIELDKNYKCIFLRGNHDAWCSSWLSGIPADSDWIMHGGRSTVSNYLKYTIEQRAIHLAFFESMTNYYVGDANRLFVHAGFASMHGPLHENDERNCYWDRTLWEMARTMDKRIKKDSKLYPKRLLLFDEIFIGHTPTLNYDVTTPMHACNVWNIDTGAAFYGRLSAMNVETKEYWQSEVVMELYPGEKGRNK